MAPGPAGSFARVTLDELPVRHVSGGRWQGLDVVRRSGQIDAEHGEVDEHTAMDAALGVQVRVDGEEAQLSEEARALCGVEVDPTEAILVRIDDGAGSVDRGQLIIGHGPGSREQRVHTVSTEDQLLGEHRRLGLHPGIHLGGVRRIRGRILVDVVVGIEAE